MKDFIDLEEEIPQINILPMIDIIFVILSFFIISSLYLVRLETIPVNLPNAENSNQEKKSVVVITLDLKSIISRSKILASFNSFLTLPNLFSI